jgi:hypothetical protein
MKKEIVLSMDLKESFQLISEINAMEGYINLGNADVCFSDAFPSLYKSKQVIYEGIIRILEAQNSVDKETAKRKFK